MYRVEQPLADGTPRPPTLHDVAAAAGVSTATVSRALNGGRVSDRRRALVVEAVRALGYRPNTLARGLVTGRTGAVGVLIPDVAGPLYATLVRGIEDVLRDAGLTFVMMTGHRDPVTEAASIELLLGRRVDALVLIGSWHSHATLAPLAVSGPPIVLVEPERIDVGGLDGADADGGEPDRGELGVEGSRGGDLDLESPVTSISLGDREAARAATVYLLERGHRRIAHLAGVRCAGERRLRGYRDAMDAAGVPLGPVIAGDFTEDAGVAAVAALLDARVDAVFCANDRMALGVYHGLATRGLRVPAAMSVIGFDALPWGAYLDPPLTTVRHHAHEMGRMAGRAVLASLRDGPRATRHIVSAAMVERESVALRGRGDGARGGDRGTARAPARPVGMGEGS